jgi:hypothetical protein
MVLPFNTVKIAIKFQHEVICACVCVLLWIEPRASCKCSTTEPPGTEQRQVLNMKF